MNGLIVCVPRHVTIVDLCDQLIAAGIDARLHEGRVTVTQEGKTVWVERDSCGEPEKEYEPDERTLIQNLVGEWIGFIVDYRAVYVADTIIAAMCKNWPCFVDNDMDFMGSAREYLERVK